MTAVQPCCSCRALATAANRSAGHRLLARLAPGTSSIHATGGSGTSVQLMDDRPEILLIAIAGIQLQVREVEEPYLRRVHGHTYRDYTTRVGRFLPWLGRTRDETNDAARHYT